MSPPEQKSIGSNESSARSTRTIPVILFGLGGVGQALLLRLLRARNFHRDHYGILFDLTCVTDSRGMVLPREDNLGEDQLIEILEKKRSGLPLSQCRFGRRFPGPVEAVSRYCVPETLVIDCTATLDTAPALIKALESGGKVVLANKKPLTSTLDLYRKLTGDPAVTRWETTVASCLPVVSTLNRIVASGDEVLRISGTYSGTLGFVMTRLQEGDLFSRVVRQAHEAGFTEPDPREDLAGTDVARKTLILARHMGWQLEFADVEVQGLVPAGFSEFTREEFLDRMKDLDDYFAVRARTNQKRGKVLRYVALLEGGECRVGPRELDMNSPLGQLRGNDNLVEIHTRLYDPQPLVLQGRGTGVDATAVGVLSDMVELVFTARR